MSRFVFIGSYTKDDGQTENRTDGIYTCQVSDDGQLKLLVSNPGGLNPSYLALHPTRPFLYATNELEANAASALAINLRQRGADPAQQPAHRGGVALPGQRRPCRPLADGGQL